MCSHITKLKFLQNKCNPVPGFSFVVKSCKRSDLEKTFQNIPFLRLTIALAIGIIIGDNLNIDQKLILAVLFFVLILLIIFNTKYKYSFSTGFGLGIHFLFMILGILVTQTYNKKPLLPDKGVFIAVILETPQEKTNSYKSILQVEAVNCSDSVIPAKELIISYFEKNDSSALLKPGNIILFNSIPQEISNYNNPYEFDYKKYLERKRIYRQVYLPVEKWIKTEQTRKTSGIRAEQIREELLQIYRSQPIDETEFEILSALTLGYKRELDPETKRIFSASGASHILAVSGLHVGIIFWVVSLIFGFLRNKKNGRFIFVLISVSILWFYAFITGLSPSVMRAATMFSIFVIGENINRKSNIYNSLAASAFFLLMINPNNLFDVGFQLSYAAVFGIVFLQPKLENLIRVKNKLIKFFWTLVTVSIAAQIATFPLTTYYFGQFPSYFWVTNIFVIPAVMILIPLGITLLLFSKIQLISNLIAFALNAIIKIIYFLLSFIDELPFAVMEISVNKVQLIFVTTIMIFIFLYLKNKKIYLIKTMLVFMLLLALSTLIFDIMRLNSTEVIVYNTAKNQGIHLIHGKENYIITEGKIKEDEIYFYPGTNTRRKLGLNPSLFLVATDSVSNKNLLLKNGLITFEGKSFSINKKFSELNKNKLPDFIINPDLNKLSIIDLQSNTTIITNKCFFDTNKMDYDKIHCTSTTGAFRKKW